MTATNRSFVVHLPDFLIIIRIALDFVIYLTPHFSRGGDAVTIKFVSMLRVVVCVHVSALCIVYPLFILCSLSVHFWRTSLMLLLYSHDSKHLVLVQFHYLTVKPILFFFLITVDPP